jgi:hypothetical protein
MKVQTIVDVQALIDKAGGVMSLASVAGVARTTVLGWRTQGFIPGNRVVQISVALNLPSAEIIKLAAPAPKRRKQRKRPTLPPVASTEPHQGKAA